MILMKLSLRKVLNNGPEQVIKTHKSAKPRTQREKAILNSHVPYNTVYTTGRENHRNENISCYQNPGRESEMDKVIKDQGKRCDRMGCFDLNGGSRHTRLSVQ
jgi:hypothetical protein